MPNTAINLEVTDIFTIQDDSFIDCNTLNRRNFPGTLNAIKVFQACHVEFEENMIITDEVGMASSPGIQFKRGIEGRYSYKYMTAKGAQTKSYSTFVQSDISSIKLITPPIITAEFGVPLSPQPKILILGLDGSPIQGKIAIAIAEQPFYTADYAFSLQCNIYII